MTRQQKYPETKSFHWHNENPKGRITGDCRIRAIATATGMEYNNVVLALALIQMETGYDQCANQGIDILMDALGLAAPVHAHLRLGEGSGAVMLLPMLDMALALYHSGQSFERLGVEAYTPQN